MIILLFHKYILVPLWVLGKAESTAVMKPALGLALTEPTARGKQRGMAQNAQAWDGGSTEGSGPGWRETMELREPRARAGARHRWRVRKEWTFEFKPEDHY